ncbi:MAG: ribosome-associated translation inhibitor RaiA [Planctomycetes bacterium]|nr:ribosome-associated translation inhibitor RaiA [Planctomycetota bacterium]
MITNITSRHFEIPDVFKKYVEYKLTKFERTYKRTTSVNVTIEMIKEGLFKAKIALEIPHKEVLTASSENHSMVKAFDESFELTLRRLRDFKDRLDNRNSADITRRIKRNLTF